MANLTKLEMVAKANTLAQFLTGDFKQIRQIVDKHELVVALWADRDEPDGVGLHIVKGRHLLEDVVATETPRELSWAAIPCICLEQAIALQQVCGNSDLH